jgi:hypothetical protein
MSSLSNPRRKKTLLVTLIPTEKTLLVSLIPEENSFLVTLSAVSFYWCGKMTDRLKSYIPSREVMCEV